MMIDENELKDMDLTRLTEVMYATKNKIEDLDRQRSELQKEYDYIRKSVIPQFMEKTGIESAKVKGIGKISVRPELYASIKKDMKDEAFAWLAANGYGDIVHPGVNSSTLKSSLKECISSGLELPDNLFNVTPYELAVITKN